MCSAFGAAIAQPRVDRTWTIGARAEATTDEHVRALFETAERDAQTELREDGYDGEVGVVRTISCRYYLQNYEQDVRLDGLDDGFLGRAVATFHDLHRSFYGYAFDTDPVELVYGKVSVAGAEPALAQADRLGHAQGPAERVGHRVVLSRSGSRDTPVLRRGVWARCSPARQ